MTYEEYCETICNLAEAGLIACGHDDDDAALLYVAALIDYVIRHGPEVHRGLPLPVDYTKLQDISHSIRPIVEIIAKRFGSRPMQ